MTFETDREPLGNVLVATDFSTFAGAAVQRAAQLPMTQGSTLTVLHVVPPGCRAEDRADAQRALDDAASAARDAAAQIGCPTRDVFPRLVEGTPFVEIVGATHHGRNDLVVVGRRGDWTFREFLLGSTAERDVRKSETAVLVVASAPTAPRYGRPLVALDCSETSRRALKLAWRLADPAVRALAVVHAYPAIPETAIRRAGFSLEDALECRRESERRARAELESFLMAGSAPIPTTIMLHDGDPRRVILDLLEERRADLVAVGSHGRSGLPYVLLGSVAEAVIRAGTCDVLVAHSPGPPS